jgi:hypothetical protein
MIRNRYIRRSNESSPEGWHQLRSGNIPIPLYLATGREELKFRLLRRSSPETGAPMEKSLRTEDSPSRIQLLS